MPKNYKFTARIEAGDRGGAFLFFPYDVEKEFGTRGRVPVTATIDGVSYRGSLIKYGAPQHMLGVEKAIRQQIQKEPGDRVEVVLKKDDEVREVEIPPAFKTLMKKEGLLTFFESLSYTHRKEYLSLDHGSQEGRDARAPAGEGRRDAAGQSENAGIDRVA